MENTQVVYDFKRSFARKAVIACVFAAIALSVALVVSRYFYYLDAYLYTYEFYWLFNINNLRTGNIPLFVDYFKPMGITTEALPQIILSHLIQNFCLPLSRPILVSAASSAFGVLLGSIYSYIALAVTGFVSFAAGTFLLGDIIPYIKGRELDSYRRNMIIPSAFVLPVFFAIPWIPVSFVAVAGAFFEVPFLGISRFLLLGLSLRILWLLVTPSLFL